MASVVVNGDTSGAVTLSAPAVAGTVTVTLPSASGTMAVLPTATGVLAESAGGTGTTTGYYGFKNRIINGAMVIDQRNAGAQNSIGSYTLDRWLSSSSQNSWYICQQNAGSVTLPAGFSKYMGYTSTGSNSVGTSDYLLTQQGIEGFNIADLAWGTASASPVTLSFWVQSSLTGTFSVVLRNAMGGTTNRTYAATYTISSANTWEQKSLTISGDTSGTWATNNTCGVSVAFGLGVGSSFVTSTTGSWQGANYLGVTGATSVVGTNGATFYITGVQLEKGSTATSFDYRPYGTELALCQRYCPAWSVPTLSSNFPFSGQAYTAGAAVFIAAYPVQPRVSATNITTSGTFTVTTNSYGTSTNGTLAIYSTGTNLYTLGINVTGMGSLVAGNATHLVASSSLPAKIIAEGCEL